MKSIGKIHIRTAIIGVIGIGCFLYTNSMEAQILKKLSKVAKEVVKEVETSVNKEIDNETLQLKNYIRCNLYDKNCIKKAEQAGKQVVLTDSNGEILKNDDGSPVIYSEQKMGNDNSSAIPAESSLKTEITTHSVEPINITSTGYSPSQEKLVIAADIWDVKQNKVIKSDWVKSLDYRGNEEVMPGPYYKVKNLPNHFFIVYGNFKAKNGFISASSKGRLYESGKEYNLPEKEYTHLGKDLTNRGILVEKNRRRAVFIYKGDLWSVDYDWRNRKYTNEKKITNRGLFDRKEILFWYGNSVYLLGSFSKENPIIQININSGEINELPSGDVFKTSQKERTVSFTNPSGKILCNPGYEFLHCYDAEQKTFFQVPIKPDGYESPVVPQNVQHQNLIWLTDEVFATVAPDAGVISRIDLSKRSIVNLFEVPPGRSGILDIVKVTPSKKFVDIVTNIRKENPPRYEQKRFLVNLVNGSAISLNLPAKINRVQFVTDGEWIHDDYYLYPKSKGSFSEMGTWLYSVKSGEHKKIGEISDFGSILAFPKYKVAYFSSAQGGVATYRVDITEGTVKKVEIKSNPKVVGSSYQTYLPYAIMEPPMDLGF